MTARDLPTLQLDAEDAAAPVAAEDDPYAVGQEDARQYVDPPIRLWGECHVDASFVVLEKGIGRRPFDPTRDSYDDRRVNWHFEIVPVTVGRQTTDINVLSKDRDFAKIVWPSIKKLGIGDARTLDGRYVQAELVVNGRFYTGRDGTERASRALQFVRLFDNEDECVAAAEAARTNRNAPPAAQTPPAAPPPVEIKGVPAEVARKFLPSLWARSGGDITVFLELVKTTAATKSLGIDDPEVMKFCLPAETEPAEGKLPF